MDSDNVTSTRTGLVKLPIKIPIKITISDTLSIIESKKAPIADVLLVTLATVPSIASKKPAIIKNKPPRKVAVYQFAPTEGECNENIIAEIIDKIKPIHVQKFGPKPKLANPILTLSRKGSNLFLKLLSTI